MEAIWLILKPVIPQSFVQLAGKCNFPTKVSVWRYRFQDNVVGV